MPFLKTIVNNNSKIGLWEINESMPKINEIAEKLNEQIPKNLTSIKRKKEWVCTRALLNEISGKSKIFYDSSGSPNIDGKFISISHSKNLVAIILSDNWLFDAVLTRWIEPWQAEPLISGKITLYPTLNFLN